MTNSLETSSTMTQGADQTIQSVSSGTRGRIATLVDGTMDFAMDVGDYALQRGAHTVTRIGRSVIRSSKRLLDGATGKPFLYQK